MSGDLRGKIPMMILSLLASMVLFFYVRSQELQTTGPGNYPLDIELRNVPQGFVAEASPSKVTWQAFGLAEAIVNIDREKLHAYVDLAGMTEGEKTLTIKLESPTYSGVDWKPVRNTAVVTLQRLTSRKVPVTVQPIGQLSIPDVVYSDATSNPKEVLVEGPRSLVEQVTRVEALLDLSKAADGMAFEETIIPMDAQGNRVGGVTVDPERVMVLPVITGAPQGKAVFISANYTGQPAFGFRVKRIEVTPPRARVTGPSESLAGFTVIETDPIDLTGLSETRMFSVRLQLPDGIRSIPDAVQVRVVVEPASQAPVDPGINDPPPTAGQ